MTTTPCGIDAFTVNVTSAYNTTKLLKKKGNFGDESHVC